MEQIFTRAQYLAAPTDQQQEAHRRFYGQFVTEGTIERVVSAIGASRLKASTDPSFNDIPLTEWDALVPRLPGSGRFKDAGDFYTLGGGVCLAKEAARQWLERQS